MNRQFSIQSFCFTLALITVGIGCPTLAPGQIVDGGGIDDGGGFNPGNPTTPDPPTTGGGGGGGGSQTGEIGDLGDGAVDPNNVEVVVSDDQRNQGFVGSTATKIQTLGFVGAASDSSGPPLAPEATFGGGVNGSSPGGVGVGGGQAGAFNAGQGGFGAVQTQNGFSVPRRNLRTRLVASIDAPVISSATIAERFQNSLSRLPQMQSQPISSSLKYQVTINNRTATVTGFVSSDEEAARIIRQLRLHPGVYQIDNQLRTN